MVGDDDDNGADRDSTCNIFCCSWEGPHFFATKLPFDVFMRVKIDLNLLVQTGMASYFLPPFACFSCAARHLNGHRPVVGPKMGLTCNDRLTDQLFKSIV